MKNGDKLSDEGYKLIELPFEYVADYNIVQADGPAASSDLSNSRYICLVAGGIKEEGKDFTSFYTSEQAAVSAYLKSLTEFLKGRRIIIWRQRPELMVAISKGAKKAWVRQYQIYSRLVAY